MTTREFVRRSLAGSLLFAAGAAHASLDAGALYQTPESGRVFAEFVSSSAGWTGSVYYLGFSPSDDDTITYETSDDAHGVGAFLFSNHGTTPGFSVDLGLFDIGATLHFAYRITAGGPIGQTTRSDLAGDVLYFALSDRSDSAGPVSRIHLEDIKGAGSDFDYNDVAFDLRLVPSPAEDTVPAPGAAALAFLAFGVARRRSRR